MEHNIHSQTLGTFGAIAPRNWREQLAAIQKVPVLALKGKPETKQEGAAGKIHPRSSLPPIVL